MAEDQQAMAEQTRIMVGEGDVVLPGDVLAVGDVDFNTPFAYRDGDVIRAAVPGVVEIRKIDRNGKDVEKVYLKPFDLTYIPRPGHMVIGMVIDIGTTYWVVDINSPYNAQLPVGETIMKHTGGYDTLRRYLDVGEYILAEILSFDRNRDPIISAKGKNYGKILDGKVIEVRLSRVPWIVGKKKSMIEAIERETGARIVIADNARIWIKGPDRRSEDLVVLAIKNIEQTKRVKPPSVEEIVDYIRKEKEEV